jgi:lactate dehydrogenase-like 2-hydroxyacid dehydrogenase
MPNISLQKAMLEYDAILSTVCDKFDHDLLSFDDRKVEVISNYAAGLDNIDLESAKKNKVFVYNVPDVVTDSTADLTIALMLSSVRNINGAQNFIKNNEWHAWDPEIFVGTELRGKTLGIVGFGRIGQAVATRALAFGLKILYYNRSKKDFQDAEYCENLDTLLNTSDIISIHLPSTEKTKGFIGVEQFKKMNKALCFINTSRGDIVSNKALITALENKYICAAALDVVEGEPIDSTHKLLEYENCIIIPHIGTATYACRENMAKAAAMNIVLHYNIRGRIETVFKNVMKQNFCIDSDMYNTSLWDSLRHLMFLSSLEQEFNINFEHQEVSKMVDGYEVIKVVAKHVF